MDCLNLTNHQIVITCEGALSVGPMRPTVGRRAAERHDVYIYIYIYIYVDHVIYIYIFLYIYICIYIYREREMCIYIYIYICISWHLWTSSRGAAVASRECRTSDHTSPREAGLRPTLGCSSEGCAKLLAP